MARREEVRRALEALLAPGPDPGAGVAGAAPAGAPEEWLADTGVQGFGIGRRVRKGRRERTVVLKVYVARKSPPGECARPVPRRVRVPGRRSPVPVDVEEVGEIRLQSARDRARPVTPGSGISSPGGRAGTLGLLVRERGGGKEERLLGSLHVFAAGGAGTGDLLLQPAAEDGGGPGDRVGALLRTVPLAPGAAITSEAAVASLDGGVAAVPDIRHLGAPKGLNPLVTSGMTVRKSGRTTELTVGQVRDPDFRMILDLPVPGGGTVRVQMVAQVLCTRFTDAGDSGAAVLDDAGKVVGLVVAGSDSSSVFSRIHPALDALDLRLA